MTLITNHPEGHFNELFVVGLSIVVGARPLLAAGVEACFIKCTFKDANEIEAEFKEEYEFEFFRDVFGPGFLYVTPVPAETSTAAQNP
jgi:hypothetical protein